MREAAFYSAIPEGRLVCELCPRKCVIAPGMSGFCKVRGFENGKLIARNYAQVSSISLDPIEKKPLYHFYPGRFILSVGTIGCNLACEFCQNWHISQEAAPTQTVAPDELAEIADRERIKHGNIGVAYTYSEPAVWFEFLMEVMPRIHERKLQNVLVTNAFLQPGPWEELLQWTDAANIDLKGFDEDYYQRLCHGSLRPVLDNIRSAVGKIHLELTTLVVPGENDDPRQMEALVRWIAALDPDIPLHLSRYYPNYRLSNPPTPVNTMMNMYRIAKKHLNYVYLGNLGVANRTCCPDCGAVWIKRHNYQTCVVAAAGSCPGCNRKITIAMEESSR